jgi:hypothetical protein
MPSEGREAGLRVGDLLLAVRAPLPMVEDALARLSLLLGCLEEVRCFAARALLADQCRQMGVTMPHESQSADEFAMWIVLPPNRVTTVISAVLQSGFSAPVVQGRLS